MGESGSGLVRFRQGNSGDPFGPGSSLQSPLRSDFRCDPCRLRSQARCALRLPKKAGGGFLNNYSSRRIRIVPHVLTAPTPPAAGSSTPLTLRCGRDSQGNGADAPSPDRRTRPWLSRFAPCARTTRAHRPGHALRPRWLRCARVNQYEHVGRVRRTGASCLITSSQENDMTDIHSIDSQAQSVTATVCENAQLYGATPGAR